MNHPANDHDLQHWLADRRPDLDPARLNPAQLRAAALALLAADAPNPNTRAQSHLALAAEFPTVPDPNHPPPPIPTIRFTPPIRITGETYRRADPKHYLHIRPDLDTSGNTIYLTNDPPPGHPDSLARTDEPQS